MMQIKINSLIVGEGSGTFWKFHHFQKFFYTPYCAASGFNKVNLIFNSGGVIVLEMNCEGISKFPISLWRENGYASS
jgi:hypothetical protein